ncbi:tryptophan dimethylallyltransferase [Moniliophthora roreri]|nr:tryptophan dimethylallyltransferase [Moniliophthora roreri]KAI3616284.1 tryptophan dimethylallyltransferase [Moniliophthora roreri]
MAVSDLKTLYCYTNWEYVNCFQLLSLTGNTPTASPIENTLSDNPDALSQRSNLHVPSPFREYAEHSMQAVDEDEDRDMDGTARQESISISLHTKKSLADLFDHQNEVWVQMFWSFQPISLDDELFKVDHMAETAWLEIRQHHTQYALFYTGRAPMVPEKYHGFDGKLRLSRHQI